MLIAECQRWPVLIYFRRISLYLFSLWCLRLRGIKLTALCLKSLYVCCNMFFCPVLFADFSMNIKLNTLNSVIIGITISHFILMLYYVKYNTQWFETRFIHLVVLYTCTFIIISMIFKYQICTNLQDMKNMH